YTLHGLRLETAKGWKKKILKATEWIACQCAHRVFSVSSSLRQRAIELGIVDPAKITVAGRGTVDGIDISRFCSTPERVAEAQRLRQKHIIPLAAPIIGFVGRFTRDKGVPELYAAFRLLRPLFPNLRLFMVGEFEDGDPVSPALRTEIEQD